MPVIVFVFVLLLLLNLPIAFVLGTASVAGLLVRDNVPLFVIPQRLFSGMDSFTMLAVPLFILAGSLMEAGGISVRLMNLAKALVGHFRGGLAQVVILASMLFADMSGSTSADTAAIGSLMIPQMAKSGYTRERGTAITAAACGMGMLIPPCLTMVVYGVVANVSISALFAAGIIPALLMAAALMAQVYFQAPKWNIPPQPRASLAFVGQRAKEAALAIGMPVIILGGILGGIVTPTEAAVLAVMYALLLGLVVYRSVSLANMLRILVNAGVTSGMVMLLIGMATLFGWLLAVENIPATIAALLSGMPGGRIAFLLLNTVIYWFFGMVMEGTPALILLVPITLPIAVRLGVDPVHYGIMLIANQGIAVMTPPVGISLFIACSVGGVNVARVSRTLIPYLLVMAGILLVITFVPAIPLFLPHVMGLH
jgi:tripartite ATP-independent transporter DctM subunit